MRHSLNFLTLTLVLKGFSTEQIKIVCSEEKWHFFNFNTDSRISLCVRAQYLKYVKGTNQGHRIVFLDFLIFVFVQKNKDFAEI